MTRNRMGHEGKPRSPSPVGESMIRSGSSPAERAPTGMRRPRVLLVYPFDAPFIETDFKLLGTFCDVSALQVHTKGDYGRLFTRFRSTEVVFSWFALPFAAVAACLARLSGRIAIVAAGGWDIARIPEIGYGRLLT